MSLTEDYWLLITAAGGEQTMGSTIQEYEKTIWKKGNNFDITIFIPTERKN